MFNNIVKYVKSFLKLNITADITEDSSSNEKKYVKKINPCDIYIVSDHSINCIQIYNHNCDAINLTIKNCPNIKSIPEDIHKFNNLENITISNCDIKKCFIKFPMGLRYFELSYSGLNEINPENSLENLAEINLSFNKLKEIPTFLNKLIDNNSHIEIKLNGNDFWFSMYSDLAISMISPKTINELVYANKLNILGIHKLQFAVNILRCKNYSNEAKWLSNQVDLAINKIKTESPKNIYSNPQNVHLCSIYDKTKESIKKILEYSVNNYNIDINIYINNFDIDVQNDVRNHLKNSIKHGNFDCTFEELFTKVLLIAKESEYFQSILFIINEELKSGLNTCLTGQLTRLVNSLSFYIPGISVSISKNEELSNSITALRKRYAILYGNDTEIYINETIPAVWQLLEDECVPENEHHIWLEYI